MTGLFALLCLLFAARFALPGYFRPIVDQPPEGKFRSLAGAGIGFFSGLAGVGGGILTNVVMTLSGMSMHKSIGRAAAAGIVVGFPGTLVAALGPGSRGFGQWGSIDLSVWASIAPVQAAAAWLGARFAQRIGADNLSRVMGLTLLATGTVMLYSSLSDI
jgi:uncharacterized protein